MSIIDKEIDATLQAIKDLKSRVNEAAELSDQQREKLDRAEDSLREIFQKGFFSKNPAIMKDLDYVSNHLGRLRELRNRGEIGSFSLSVTRITDAAWQQLT